MGPERPSQSFTDTVELDLANVEPSLAGPRRPQDRVALANTRREFRREPRKKSPTIMASILKSSSDGSRGRKSPSGAA